MILENFKNGYEVSNGSLIAKGEKNDCFVRACANAFNITYDVAHGFVAKEFKRKARKGTQNVFSTLSKLGSVTFELFSNTLFPETRTYGIHPIARSKSGKVVNTKYTHKEVNHTVKTFCEQYNKGTYIVIVRKHALTIKDGIVIDNPNYRFTGYRRIVESAVKIS